jgi:hypothetical protein
VWPEDKVGAAVLNNAGSIVTTTVGLLVVIKDIAVKEGFAIVDWLLADNVIARPKLVW